MLSLGILFNILFKTPYNLRQMFKTFYPFFIHVQLTIKYEHFASLLKSVLIMHQVLIISDPSCVSENLNTTTCQIHVYFFQDTQGSRQELAQLWSSFLFLSKSFQQQAHGSPLQSYTLQLVLQFIFKTSESYWSMNKNHWREKGKMGLRQYSTIILSYTGLNFIS